MMSISKLFEIKSDGSEDDKAKSWCVAQDLDSPQV